MAFFLRKECFRSWIALSRDWREIGDSGRNHVKISSVKSCRELKNGILYRSFVLWYFGVKKATDPKAVAEFWDLRPH